MAKFCAYCGAPLEDGATVCSSCQTPCAPIKTKKPSGKVKKYFLRTVIFLLIAGILWGAAAAALQFTGYRAFLRTALRAFEQEDEKALAALGSTVLYYAAAAGDDPEEYFEQAAEDVFDPLRRSVGRGCRFSWDIQEINRLDKKERNRLLRDLEDACPDLDLDFIEEVVVADVAINARHKGKHDQEHVEVTLSREDGVWRILSIE